MLAGCSVEEKFGEFIRVSEWVCSLMDSNLKLIVENYVKKLQKTWNVENDIMISRRNYI